MIAKPKREELVALLQQRGWDLVTGSPTTPTNRTLEEAARLAHSRRTKGEKTGVRHLETAIELDLIQLEQLWEHLGLPM